MFATRFLTHLVVLASLSGVRPSSLWPFDARTEQAKAFLEKGQLQQAELLLIAVIESKPDSFDANYLLGTTYARAHRTAEAIPHFEKAIQINPNSAEALTDLGEIYLNKGERDKGISLLGRSLALEPGQPATQYTLGMVFLENGDYRQAAVHLALARTYGLKHTGVILNLGRVYLKMKRIDEAEDALNELLRISAGDWRLQLEVGKTYFENLLYEDAKPPLARAWELNRDSYEAGFYLALDHFLLGEQAESLNVLLELKAKGLQSVEVENLLGAVYSKLGQVDRATDVLKKVIEERPEKPDAYFNLGLIKLEYGQRQEAMSLIERGGRLYRGEAKVFYILGAQQACAAFRRREETAGNTSSKSMTSADRANFYLRLGEVFEDRFHFTTAAELLGIAQEIDPENLAILLRLGISCYNLDEVSSALEMFLKAASLRPNLDRAIYFVGNCYMSLGKVAEAIEAYRRAIQIAPQDPTYNYRLGRALFQEGHIDEALSTFRFVLTLSPDDAGTHSALGRIYLKLRQEDRAVAEFQEAIRLDPALPEPYYHLAKYYARTRRAAEAEEFSRLFQKKTEIARRTPGQSGYIRAKE